MKPLILAAALLLASPALAAPPGVVTSSDPNAIVEYVQFGGPNPLTSCYSDPCVITSGSPAVVSVNRVDRGYYTVNFAAGTFSEPPTCTAAGNNGFALVVDPGLTRITLVFIQSIGVYIDTYGYVICVGPYPAR